MHWLTDLAGAEPTPLHGAEKLVLKFPHPVLHSFISSLASVGARAVVDKKNALYEAVNKPSRAKFFVGMHNESTFKRTNRLGAFVCFKQAEKGGEFLLLDGQKVRRRRRRRRRRAHPLLLLSRCRLLLLTPSPP